MKKTLSILLVLLLAISCVFAYQKTYRLSSDEVQTFLLLRKASGSITPDPSYPISASQLVTLLHGIDSSKLTGKYAQLYEDLLNDLENPMVYFGKNNFGMDADLSILGIQAIKSLDPSIFYPAKDRAPMVEGKAELFFGDYAYGMFDGDYRIRNYYIFDRDLELENGEDKAVAQYYTLKNLLDGSLVVGAPYTAFASMGFENYNFIVGRDRLGSGNGYTGNLELGENSLFEDFAKLSFINDWVSYDFILESFNHKDGQGGDWDISPDTMKKNIFIHRISFDIEEKANFSFYEGALIWEESPFTNLQYFNPFMFMHNYGSYHDASTNNFMGLEIMTNVFDGIQIDAQVFFDQLYVSFVEQKPEDSGESAYEILLNTSKSYEVNDGILDLYAEGVYGSANVYLKNYEGYGIDPNEKKYTDGINEGKPYNPMNTDLILDMQISDWGDEFNYLGYKYGGDLKSIAVGAIYRKGGYKFTADVQYLAKGSYGIGNQYSRKTTPTDGGSVKYVYNRDFYEQRICDVRENPVVQHTIMANFGFDGPVYKGIDLSAKLGLLYHINYHHEELVKKFDLQYSVGVTVHPDKFMRRAVKKAL